MRTALKLLKSIASFLSMAAACVAIGITSLVEGRWS
jgi:hypothetical protein